MTRNTLTVKGASNSQLLAPSVLGMTSENISIAKVMPPAIRASKLLDESPIKLLSASLNIIAACEPTPIAPTVWAMVFNVRIAASGWSMSALKRARSLAIGLFLFCCMPTKAGVILRSTASNIEQRKEKIILTRKKVTKSPINMIYACFSQQLFLHE